MYYVPRSKKKQFTILRSIQTLSRPNLGREPRQQTHLTNTIHHFFSPPFFLYGYRRRRNGK